MTDKHPGRGKAPPATRTARFMKLAGMTASVATRYAGQRMRRLLGDEEGRKAREERVNEQIAEQIAETLGELKGAIMKVGQIASQTQDFLPREVTLALQKLQKEAPPMPFRDIAAQIRAELGDDPERIFGHIDEQPHAAASIGQVHRARTRDGREVIVKVQYPGVDRSVDSDLRQLRLTLKLGGLLKIPKDSVDQLFNEIRLRLSEELDYTNEARNIERFRQFHRGETGLIIPEVLPELSSRRVLTLAFEDGDHVSAVQAPIYTQEIVNLIGHRLFKTMADQLFSFQAIHGDPHAGNFAFRPDGTVIIYDFGCVKHLKPEIVAAYRRTLKAALRADYRDLDRCLIDLGVRIESQPAVDEAYYALWRDILIRPFASRDETYDFASADLHRQVAAQAPTVLEHLEAFRPPVESIFIDRMIAGHYWLLKRLGVQAAFRAELESYL